MIDSTLKKTAMKESLRRCQGSVKHVILPTLDGREMSYLDPKFVFDLIWEYCPNITHLDFGPLTVHPKACIVPAVLARNLKFLKITYHNPVKHALCCLLKNAENLEELNLTIIMGMDCLLQLSSKNIKRLSVRSYHYRDIDDIILEQVINSLPNLQCLSVNDLTAKGSIASMSKQLFPNTPQFYEDYLLKLTFPNLKELDLSWCRIHVKDSTILHLTNHAPLIEHLDLQGCTQLTDVGFFQLKTLVNLKYLNVQETNISGNVFENLSSSLKALESIDCRFCQNVTDVNLSGIAAFFPNLKFLKVDGEKVTENFFEAAEGYFRLMSSGKKRRVTLFVFFGIPVSVDKFYGVEDESQNIKHHQKTVLRKRQESNLFDIHVFEYYIKRQNAKNSGG